MTPLLHRQPWKLLYLICFATKTIFVSVPLWTLVSILRSQRPRRSWSITRCLHVYFLRSIIEFPIKLGVLVKRDLTVEVPDRELRNSKFVWVEGVQEESLQGELRNYVNLSGVAPARIPGYWQFKNGTNAKGIQRAKDKERVVYHLHGGALYLGSAHPADATARIPRGILKHSTTIARTFAVDYRLCGSAPFPVENPFPAALLDCIAGYQYLIDLGFQPENIILVGDSAGGNIALALMRYLTKNATPGMTPPRSLILLSPWGDPTSSRTDPTSTLITNMGSDIFPLRPPTTRGFGAYAITSYLGSAFGRDEGKTNPYISPASPYIAQTDGMFKAFPKTYILVGGAERLLGDAKVITERMRADNPAEGWVTLDVEKDAVHDFVLFPWHEPERSQALGRISMWIDEN